MADHLSDPAAIAQPDACISVADQLQELVVKASAAIAGRENWGRERLEILRRDLMALCQRARADHRGAVTARMVLNDLTAGIDDHTTHIIERAARARACAGLPPIVPACASRSGHSAKGAAA